MTTRLYIVIDTEAPEGTKPRLIDAGNPAQAVKHVAQRFVVTAARPKDVAELMAKGVKVETAGDVPE